MKKVEKTLGSHMDSVPPKITPREVPEDEQEKRKEKDGMDKAMDILDEYYKDTPERNPNFDHGGED